MKEFLREKGGRLALLASLSGLGSIAITNTPAAAANKRLETQTSGITVRAIYFTNGTRELVFDGSIEYGQPPPAIFEFCDGKDLVEVSTQYGGSSGGNAASSETRSVDYPGCADGKLTPSDFKLHSAPKQ